MIFVYFLKISGILFSSVLTSPVNRYVNAHSVIFTISQKFLESTWQWGQLMTLFCLVKRRYVCLPKCGEIILYIKIFKICIFMAADRYRYVYVYIIDKIE